MVPDHVRKLFEAVRLRPGVRFYLTKRGRPRYDSPRGTIKTEEHAVFREHPAALAALIRGDAPAEPEPPKPAPQPVIPESDYPMLGLYRSNGVITHALGDKVAADILAGRIPREDAVEMEQRAQQERSHRHTRWNAPEPERCIRWVRVERYKNTE
jgi:hypothetical protein